MKTLLSAVLLIAVSAWGQSKPATGKAGESSCNEYQTWQYATGNGAETTPVQIKFPCKDKPKPHKPKPSVTPDPRDGACFGCDGRKGSPIFHVTAPIDPCDGWSCTKPAEEFHWSCLGDCGGVPEGTKWEILPFNHDAILLQQPAKPVEMLPRVKYDEPPSHDAVVQQWGDWPPDQHVSKPGDSAVKNCDDPAGEGFNCPGKPDKAAVPVEHKCDQCDFGVEPFRTQIVSWPNGAFVTETEKQIVALLPPDEYSHLEQLRASVVEEEKRLAKKYGASVPDCSRFFGSRMYFNTPHGVSTSFTCMGPGAGDTRWPTFAIDEYEFHGQFLLIQKGEDPNVISLDARATK